MKPLNKIPARLPALIAASHTVPASCGGVTQVSWVPERMARSVEADSGRDKRPHVGKGTVCGS